eukprot:6213052-Pleurochrysis_carterae.AAC.2
MPSVLKDRRINAKPLASVALASAPGARAAPEQTDCHDVEGIAPAGAPAPGPHGRDSNPQRLQLPNS